MFLTTAIACLPLVLQTPCGSPGPDLIVGDINGPTNSVSVGGVDLVAFGISPCNVGSVWVNYAHSTPQHPVFGESVYRLKVVDGATRFEELGQNWLFHGFFALSQSLCCTCTPTDGSHLGIGCSDSNSSSFLNQQTLKGPRWQVNAATGVFTFPAANPPFPNTIDRRLQIAVADIEATVGPGAARFFAEVHCIAADDAAAGHKDNNASFRELSTANSGGEWSFAMTGTTDRERPAIYAWQDADPSVVVNEVQVPNDGRFLLASRATDLGGGVWHYEYALYNQNSDRSARAFRVPLPIGVVPSNEGFHDVAYHSGDGPGNVDFDGTDWSVAKTPGEISFSTTPYDVNESANALRWSTTYNFRFESTTPPGNGIVQIDLFKPGSPDSVTAAAIVPFLVPPPPRGFCDSLQAACPCANSTSVTHGCENSAQTGGAVINASGNQSLSADGVTVTTSGELPTALSLVLQGDQEIAPVFFGDGARCAGGTLKRLYARNAIAGSITAPQPGDPSISERSSQLGDEIEIGESRIYQVYYRDANPTWCPPPQGSTFNSTPAVEIVWGT